MEYAFSVQEPFLSHGLEAEKIRKMNLNMALCGLACPILEGNASEGQRVALIENSPWNWAVISKAATQKNSLLHVLLFLY